VSSSPAGVKGFRCFNIAMRCLWMKINVKNIFIKTNKTYRCRSLTYVPTQDESFVVIHASRYEILHPGGKLLSYSF
jgi:hypothetical protein